MWRAAWFWLLLLGLILIIVAAISLAFFEQNDIPHWVYVVAGLGILLMFIALVVFFMVAMAKTAEATAVYPPGYPAVVSPRRSLSPRRSAPLEDIVTAANPMGLGGLNRSSLNGSPLGALRATPLEV